MSDSIGRLEGNELVFLRGHRSATYDLGFATLFVSSDPSPLTWNFAGALRDAGIPPGEAIDRTVAYFTDWNRKPCIKLTPAAPDGWETELRRRGWTPRVRLNHMILSRVPERSSGEVHVRISADPDHIQTFSRVQSAGFGAPEWFDWVHKVNVLNARDPRQRFYVAELDARPVGVALMVSDEGVGGLYAVATLEEARGKGVARALIATAADDSRAIGNDVLCLNTLAGGPAETVFRGAGFEDVFESRFFAPDS